MPSNSGDITPLLREALYFKPIEIWVAPVVSGLHETVSVMGWESRSRGMLSRYTTTRAYWPGG